MDKTKKADQDKETQGTREGMPRDDRFARIAPAEHAENRVQVRKPHARKKRPPRPRSSGRNKGRRSRLQLSVFFGLVLLLCYGAAVYLVVPAVVLGPLAREAGQSLDCRLNLGTFSLSPFTFRFRSERISLTSSHPVGDGKPLLQVGAVSGKVLLLPLLQGKVRVQGLRIEQPQVFLTRERSGRYNLPAALVHVKDRKILSENRLGLAPDFLSFQIVDGTFVFDDQLTGSVHRIKQVQFNPVDTAGVWLQAIVNGSPVTISRGAENLLELKLNKVELGRYLTYLPVEKDSSLSMSGRADGTLELSLPRAKTKTGRRFVINGVLSLQNVNIIDSRNGMKADIPTGGLSFELALPEGRLRIRQLVLRQPSFALKTGSFPAVRAGMASWLGKTAVQRLLIDRGRLALQAGSKTFHFQDLQTSIQEIPGNRIGNGSSPATFQLSSRLADDMDGELTIKGTLARGTLNGHLRVRGIELADLPKTFGNGLTLAELKGTAELDAELLVQPAAREDRQWLHLRNSRLQLHDVQAVTVGGEKLGARRLLCQSSDSLFGTTAGQPFCDRLDLEQAEIRVLLSGAVQLVKDAVENGSPLFDDLELLDSTIHLVGHDTEDLVSLERVLVRLHGLAGRGGAPGKIGLQAGIGKKGLIRLSGTVADKKAQLEYAFKDIELTDVPVLRSWSSLQIKEGRIRARGRLDLPDAGLTGKFVVDDLLAVDPAGGSLQWRQLTAQGAHLQLRPPGFLIDEATLDEPVVWFQQGTDGFFPPFAPAPAPDAWWRDRFAVQKLVLAGGTFGSGREAVLPGWYPLVTGLSGTVEGWPANPFSFTMNGSLEGGPLQVSGRVEDTAVDYALQVAGFPLAPLGEDFLQAYGLAAANARLSWQPADSTAADRRQQIRCVVKNLRPVPGSPLEYTLALLTDSNEEVVLNVEPVEEDGRPLLLVPRIVDRLQAIRLRELDQPGVTLQERFPFLELPDNLEFQAGLDSSDGLYSLDDYAELLQSRPHLRLVVVGSVDPVADGTVLREVLQEEADTRLELENLRRQQKRDQWLFREKAAAVRAPGSSVESAMDAQVPEALRPLPRLLVKVPPEMLENLADKRAEQVRQYLISRQGIAPGRIVVRDSIRVGSTAVYLSLEALYSAGTGENPR